MSVPLRLVADWPHQDARHPHRRSEPGVALSVGALREAAARQLASYKLPRVIVILAAGELPMLPSSKVDRRALAGLLAAAR